MYYHLWLIWLRDPDMFARYQKTVAPIAERYGSIERSLTPFEVHGDLALPDIVNVTHTPAQGSLESMNADPQFQAVVHLRTESVDLARVGGVDDSGPVTDSGLTERRYLIELARFGEAIHAADGYHVERVLRPAGDVEGLPFVPDLVRVAYFDNDAAYRLQADLEGPRLRLHARARTTSTTEPNVSYR